MTDDLRVVGIGASAGGIEALRGFFQNMPANDRLAFVVMLHLSPDRTSMLAEVLGRWTDMPVEQAINGVAVAAGHVYVIPPNTLMTIEAGRLHLRAPTTPMRENTPIDIFFTSLAADCGPRAIGVVLSGTGSDGALGLKAIKQAGGVSLVQGGDGSGPQYSGMPASAIATGAVDLILPVDVMPQHILRLGTRPEHASSATRRDRCRDQRSAARDLRHSAQPASATISAATRNRPSLRRVQRRMQFIGLGLAGLRAAPAHGSGRGRIAVPRPADRRHHFFRDRKPSTHWRRRAAATVRRQRRRQCGAHLGAGLRHRRGGLFARHPVARVHGDT